MLTTSPIRPGSAPKDPWSEAWCVQRPALHRDNRKFDLREEQPQLSPTPHSLAPAASNVEQWFASSMRLREHRFEASQLSHFEHHERDAADA